MDQISDRLETLRTRLDRLAEGNHEPSDEEVQSMTDILDSAKEAISLNREASRDAEGTEEGESSTPRPDQTQELVGTAIEILKNRSDASLIPEVDLALVTLGEEVLRYYRENDRHPAVKNSAAPLEIIFERLSDNGISSTELARLQADVYGHVGVAYRMQPEDGFETARTYLEDALTYAQQTEDPAQIALAYVDLCDIYRHHADIDDQQAVEAGRKAVDAANQSGDRRARYRAHSFLGLSLLNVCNFTDAVLAYEAASELCASEKDEAYILSLLAFGYTQKYSHTQEESDAEAGLRHSEEAEKICDKLGDWQGLARVVGDRADLYYWKGRFAAESDASHYETSFQLAERGAKKNRITAPPQVEEYPRARTLNLLRKMAAAVRLSQLDGRDTAQIENAHDALLDAAKEIGDNSVLSSFDVKFKSYDEELDVLKRHYQNVPSRQIGRGVRQACDVVQKELHRSECPPDSEGGQRT
jgi:hypothetical protein